MAKVLSGAFVGAVLFQTVKQSLAKGILIEGASALAATYVSFYARMYLTKVPYLKDPMVGAVEDVVAGRSGLSLMK